MKKKVPESRRIAALGGATAALSSNSLVLFKQLPHTAFYGSVRSLALGLPIGITLALFYRMKRRARLSSEQ